MARCCGQWDDDASNMAGSQHGVAVQLLAEEPRALLTHAMGHTLDLAVVDAMKQALDTAFEISKIRFSLKRNATFDKIKVKNPDQDESVPPSHGLRSFHPRWTVRGDAVASIIDNYDTLKRLWDECLQTKLEPDVKGCIIGVQTQMLHYNTLFGLQLSKKNSEDY